MPRLAAVDPATADGKAKTLLEAVQKKLGAQPNMMRTMAQSPAVLEGFLGLMGSLSTGTLGGALGTRIALAVARANECDYCVAAHAFLGRSAGLGDADIGGALRSSPAGNTARETAALRLALAVVQHRGAVSDADLGAARAAGLSDGELGEIVAHVALNIFTNYFNRFARPDLDFPQVEARLRSA